MNLNYEALARRIDHALLAPTLTEAEMIEGCQLAAAYEVASVCVKPAAIARATQELRDSIVRVGSVVGFPHGGQATKIKVAETIEAMNDGAVEIDMVVNIGDVLSGRWPQVSNEIQGITQAVRDRGLLIKVIFENCYLTDEQKIRLCHLCSEAGVDYVKTSTGFGTSGATIGDLLLMKSHIEPKIKLKASGGVRDLQAALDFVEIGAERLGTSHTQKILEEFCRRFDLPSRDVSRETTEMTDRRSDY